MSQALSIVGRLLVEGSAAYLEAKEIEEANDYSDAMESMERKYWEGQLDALVELYRLTYDISFAIGARNEASR